MQIIHATNVNDAYTKGSVMMLNQGVKSESRAGTVTVFPVPVTTVYSKPTERVLFNESRDANPFFHFFEALWMLEGRNDARWLDQFVGDFSKRFAEDNGLQWGAYGYRWRYQFGKDQLDIIIDRLKADHTDRRCVIQMWDPEVDLNANKRDVPCNTQIYPRIMNGKLDITVCCRSNDMIWGAYGSNIVHFSMLQEYLAGRIGVPVGVYYQMSNNLHVYDATLDKIDVAISVEAYPGTEPIGENWPEWDSDLQNFMQNPDNEYVYKNEWFYGTVLNMWNAHRAKKESKMLDALEYANRIEAPDWRKASIEWLQRRIK